jgi:transcriptional regulator with XRE-family HTH domain
MSPDDIKALRRVIGATQRDLAEALEIDVALVRDWEKGERFPTLANCQSMEKLRGAPPIKKKGAKTPIELLGDPAFFVLVRKLLTHAPLRAEVDKLAAGYADPLDDPDDDAKPRAGKA